VLKISVQLLDSPLFTYIVYNLFREEYPFFPLPIQDIHYTVYFATSCTLLPGAAASLPLVMPPFGNMMTKQSKNM
jgi:hypothetical protein